MMNETRIGGKRLKGGIGIEGINEYFELIKCIRERGDVERFEDLGRC